MLRIVAKSWWVVGVAAWLAVGCARPVRVETSNPGPGGTGGAELASSLEVEIGAEDIRFMLRVTNGATAEEVVLRFPTAQRFDFLVLSSDGETVWRWSEGRLFAQVLGTERLAPGETVYYTAVWDYPADLTTGRFRAVGRVTASNRTVERSTWFRLE